MEKKYAIQNLEDKTMDYYIRLYKIGKRHDIKIPQMANMYGIQTGRFRL